METAVLKGMLGLGACPVPAHVDGLREKHEACRAWCRDCPVPALVDGFREKHEACKGMVPGLPGTCLYRLF